LSSDVSDRVAGWGKPSPAGNVGCRDAGGGHCGSHQDGLRERRAAATGRVEQFVEAEHQTGAAGHVEPANGNKRCDFRVPEATG